MAVEEGKAAPDFSLTSDAGETVSLSSLRGKPVVLYFYPKDDTPGCTTQACGIRDAWGEFERSGAVVLGVSPDNEASHVKFKQKFDLPFTLLADPDHATADDVRRLGREVDVREDVHGRRAVDVRDRRRRHARQGDAEGQARDPRRRRARRPGGDGG